MPKIIAKPAEAVAHAIESAVEKVKGRHHHSDKEAAGLEPVDGKREPEVEEQGKMPTPVAENGSIRKPD